jgi:hypothetical protein
LENRLSNNSFAATTAPAALAELEPIPLPVLCVCYFDFKSRNFRRYPNHRKQSRARDIFLRFDRQIKVIMINNPHISFFNQSHSHSSHGADKAKPRQSNPQTTLATLEGDRTLIRS